MDKRCVQAERRVQAEREYREWLNSNMGRELFAPKFELAKRLAAHWQTGNRA